MGKSFSQITKDTKQEGGQSNADGYHSNPDNNPGPGRVIYMAVVDDFISNPNNLTEADLEKYKAGGPKGVQNSDQLGRMPRGSIIATIASDGSSKLSNKPVILYPFFSSHFSLPVKPGEQIWCIYEKIDNTSGYGYWLTRIHAPEFAEDCNYSHRDRTSTQKASTSKPTSYEKFSGLTDDSKPGFTAGGGSRNSAQTLPGKKNPYKTIVDTSISYSQFTGDIAPKFSQRCSDFVLQGSNNCRIVLGEDRTGPLDNDPSITGAGTIDMVVGVGQSSNTAPPTRENTRKYIEADKTSDSQNVSEGDPDFATDLCRIYVSMKTDGDTNFSIAPTSVGSTTTSNSGEGPYIVMKSSHPRVIAKNDGSVKIIHEAGSSIVMDSSGNIQIQCKGKVEIGKSNASQPFVRGAEFATAVATFATAMKAVILPTPAGPAPFLGAVDLAVDNFTSQVSESLSSVMFGE